MADKATTPVGRTGADVTPDDTASAVEQRDASVGQDVAPAAGGPVGRRGLPLPQATLARHGVLLLVGAVLVLLILQITGDFQNYQFAQLSFFVIAAAGLTVLTGLNGQISLGHGALMAVGAYTTALLVTKGGLGATLSFVIAVVVTAVVGALVGAAAARLTGPYLAGATLALAVGLPGLAAKFKGAFGGEQGLTIGVSAPNSLGESFPLTRWQAYIGWAAALLTVFVLANLVRSRYGRSFRAVRDDQVAAELAGIHVARTQVLAFVVSSACAGLAGAVYAVVITLVAPTGFTLVLSLGLLTAIVLGGLGSLLGVLWGSLLLVFLPQISTDLAAKLHLSSAVGANIPPAFYGVVLVVVMLVAPAGIQGTIAKRRLARSNRAAAST